MNYCNKCGKCCQVVWLGFSKEYITNNWDRFKDNPDAQFVLDNFTEIDKEEALKINPYMVNKALSGIHPNHFYKCSKFNNKETICNDYQNRPSFCKRHPMDEQDTRYIYINDVKKLLPTYALYSEDCGFNKLIVTEEELDKHALVQQ